MQPPYRLRDKCLSCENRGFIFVGGQDTSFLCPWCNPWCTLCLADAPSPFTFRPPRIGGLLVGVQPSPEGEMLFRGYCCDFHKLFRSYSYIAPWMLDSSQFQLGTAYIAVQSGRAGVVLYGYGEAANWQDLEADAWQVAKTQGALRYYGGIGYATCPADLTVRALRWTLNG